MNDEPRRLTISVFTENRTGMLHRVTASFTRRKLNIDSITASETETEGLHRYTIVLTSARDQADKVVQQLERQVDVMKAFVHEEHEVIHQEIALYKLAAGSLVGGVTVEDLVRRENARVLWADAEFLVLEKTGHPEETQELYNRLVPLGILEFVRSGRVAVSRPMKRLIDYMDELSQTYDKNKES